MGLKAQNLLYPSKSTLLFTGILLLSKNYTSLTMPRLLRNLVLLLFLLNWNNWPFVWHWSTILKPVLFARKEQFLAWLGLHQGNAGGRGRELGVSSRYWHLQPLGRSPFDANQVTYGKCGWGQADLFLHMSNSVYPQQMDFGRAAYACNFFGAPTAYEDVMVLLGGVSTVFLKEISMFQEFMVETRIAGWNDRWGFALSIFTVATSAQGKQSGKEIIIQTAKGPRTLCCLGLSKCCFKVPKFQGNAHPARIWAAAGFGEDASNWNRIQELREQGGKAAEKWIMSNEGPTGIEPFEEKNQKALKIIDRLGGGEQKGVWLELLSLLVDVESDKL